MGMNFFIIYFTSYLLFLVFLLFVCFLCPCPRHSNRNLPLLRRGEGEEAFALDMAVLYYAAYL